jgi:hypothetical protein
VTAWPEVALDPVDRARILAAAIPGAGYVEAVFDVPFDEAWPRIADLERSVPAADRLVHRLRIGARRPLADGAEALDFTTLGILGRSRFEARLEQGWCLMQTRTRSFVVVMAARPEGERTRYGHLEAVPRRGGRLLRGAFRRTVADDVTGFERVARGG